MNAVRSMSIAKPVAAAAGAAVTVALIGMTVTDLGPWYQSLQKPAWQPPDWLFGPVWTLIFALAALSAVIGWRSTTGPARREWMVVLFAVNGFLNILWSLLFFRLHRPDWALAEVGLLWLSIAALMIFLGRFAKPAAWLLAPYLVWVSFAAVLNATVVKLNAPF